MADSISKHDRALIDAAIKAGNVSVIPSGVSGVAEEPVSWRKSRNTQYSIMMKKEKMQKALRQLARLEADAKGKGK